MIVAAMAGVGEALELLAGSAGASRKGASRRAMLLSLLLSIVGSLVGTFIIPIPVVGSAIGAVGGAALGAFWGAWLGEAWIGTDTAKRNDISTAAMIVAFSGCLPSCLLELRSSSFRSSVFGCSQADHRFVVPNNQLSVHEYRRRPALTFENRSSELFTRSLRLRGHDDKFSFFGQYHQFVSDPEILSESIAAFFPEPLSCSKIQRCQNPIIQSNDLIAKQAAGTELGPRSFAVQRS